MTDQSDQRNPICHRKPEIVYPCPWEYKVIGTDREKLTQIILAACLPAKPTISLSNVSSGGKYCSLNATLEVDSEEMRLAVFRKINEDPAVKLVI